MDSSQNKRFTINPGILSLITFFTVLLLTVFSVLILSSATSDLRLSQMAADSVSSQYAADLIAEEKFSELASIYNESSESELVSSLNQASFTVLGDADFEGTVVEYFVPITDKKQIHVIIGITESGEFEKLSWKTVVDTSVTIE